MSVAADTDVDLEQLFEEPPPKCEVTNQSVPCKNDAAYILLAQCTPCGNKVRRFICQAHHDKFTTPSWGWWLKCRDCGKMMPMDWRPL